MAKWQLVESDVRDFLPSLADKSVDVVICDPPYSSHVHKSVRSAKRNEAPDVSQFECRTRRTVDLGFEHLTPSTRRFMASEFSRLSRRWVLAFGDDRSAHWIRIAFEAAGLEFVRMMAWIRTGGAPQFSGDRPASGLEWIVLAHPPGKKHWNGGGRPGLYECPIVANRAGHRHDRVHTTQKPVALMMDLVGDFSQPGETILDPFAGSGTTGVASLRMGRNFIGVERMAEHAASARERLTAEEEDTTASALRAKQMPMFPKKSE